MKYKKKQVEIDAFQLNNRGLIEDDWFWDAVTKNEIIIHNFGEDYPGDAWCEIMTLEGVMTASSGDYIIKGIMGEIYPCKPDIFEATYEEANEMPRQIRKFKCLETFCTEGRYCYEGEIYEAHPFYDYYKFLFENGEMNFSDDLFGRVIEEWKDVVEEII